VARDNGGGHYANSEGSAEGEALCRGVGPAHLGMQQRTPTSLSSSLPPQAA